MDARLQASLETALRDRRAALLERAAETEAELTAVEAEPAVELVERGEQVAMARLLARLDDQTRREIYEIDAALDRMYAGEYGRCTACRQPIPVARLRALPATALCLTCAEQAEPLHVAGGRAKPVAQPVDLSMLSNREIEDLVRRTLREDPRIDDEALRIHYRRGVLRVDGSVPTADAHALLRGVLEDTFGFREIIDHVTVEEVRP
ncbi:MAG TPA: TraR/DksA C4-type zinc finger protein [Candidatus Limnocylindria bacterium]|nr:TraR/DksA C4-type zinc finger protein [Candidatus Limnocylindria bacterium]